MKKDTDPNTRTSILTTLLLLIVCVSATGIYYLSSAVNDAPFRLRIKTNYTWLILQEESEISLISTQWTLHDSPPVSENSEERDERIERQEATAPTTDDAFTVIAELDAGEVVELKLEGHTNSSKKVALVPRKSTAIRISSAAPYELIQSDALSNTRTTKISNSLIGYIGATSSNRLELSLLASANTFQTPTRLQSFGFVTLGDNRLSGVINGTLQFLDKPMDQIEIFRGSNISISGNEIALESISYEPDGIIMHFSGFASHAALTIGSKSLFRPHNILPTNFDRARQSPAATTTIGAIGLILAMLSALLPLSRVGRK